MDPRCSVIRRSGRPCVRFFHQRAPVATQVLRYEIFPPEKSSFVRSSFALSPDGKHLAFAAVQEGPARLWVRDLGSVESRPLPGTEGASSPSGHKLERMDLSGGTPQAICDVDYVIGGAWNSDGTIIFGNTRGLMKVSAAGGSPSRLTVFDTSRGKGLYAAPSFLPDRQHFLYSRGWDYLSARTFLGSLIAGDSQPGGKPLAAGQGPYAPASGSGPGIILFVQRNGALMAQGFDVSGRTLKGDPIAIADDVDSFTASADVLAYFRKHSTDTADLVR